MKALHKRISVVLVFFMMIQLFAPLQVLFDKVGAASGLEDNLIPNGDFEEKVSANGWTNGTGAKGWGFWKASGNGQLTVTEDEQISGSSSLEIKHLENARTGLSIDIPISGGESYTLSTWIKTEDVVSSGGVFVRTQYFKKINGVDGSTTNEKVGDGPATVKIDGTNDWTQREAILSVPAEAKYVRLEPFFEVGVGTAWFDNMTLTSRKGITKLELDPKVVTLAKDDSIVLTPIFTPQDVEDTTVVWTSSDEDIAIVEDGIVTAQDDGFAVITVSTPDGLVSGESFVTVESADRLTGYDVLRQKWYEKLVGGASMDINDPDVELYIATLSELISNSDSTGLLDRIDTSPSAEYLWQDMIGKTNTDSSAISKAYSAIKSMALAYSTEGTAQFKDEQLKTAIIAALDWMHTYQYNETKASVFNWFDYEIGSPQSLMDILVLMYDDLSAELLDRYLNVIDKFVPDPLKRVQNANVTETGANLLDKALVVVLRGVVGKQGFKIEQGKKALEKEFLYVTSGDGIYEDGSLVQHFNVAYTGAYGGVLIGRMADLLFLLNESPWENEDPNVENVYKWIDDTFEALIYKGAMMDMVKGRSIARPTDSDHLTGRSIIRTIARLADGAPAYKAEQMKSMIKAWVEADTTFENYFENMPIYEMNLIKATMNDSSIVPREELIKHQNFAGMDRVVHLRPNYGFALSMFSDRISAFEFGNGENKKGWYTGIGMTSLYNDDLTQYSNQYWPTVDMYRLAGTTTDGYAPAPADWGAYMNSKTWVGGSSLDSLYGAVGMEFALDKSTTSKLSGKKSWFMFDDEIVALGSDIKSTDNRLVETIVENRQLTQLGANKLTVDGVLKSDELGWNESMKEISWAHLEGNTESGSDIGYYFPLGADITGKREARTGSWKDINNGASSETVTRNYLSMAFNHGNAPQSGSYAYVVLPNKSVDETETYSETPNIEILSQTIKSHAVREHDLGITAVNFWTADKVEFIRAVNPASVMVKEEGNILTVSVSDPTQKQSKVIVDLGKEVLEEITSDASITVLQTTPYLKLEVDTSDAIGKSHIIQFKYDPAATPQLGENTEVPEENAKATIYVKEDAYVNAGSKAADNFGNVGYLNVKNGVNDYLRKTFLKYDLSSISGEIKSVKLNVYAKKNDNRGSTAQVGVYQVEDNSWSEGSINWGNMPSVGELIETITIDGYDEWRQYDVTAFAKSRMEQDKEISLALQGESDLTVEVRSKENEGGIYKSYLEITFATEVEPVEPGPDQDDEYDELRMKWFNYLTGGDQIDLNDEDIRRAVEANALKVTNDDNNGVWDTLITKSDRSSLWADYNSTTDSSHVTLSYNRLKDMAIAYATPGTDLYQRVELKNDIVAGLDWMHEHRFNTTRATYNNWWDWQIGSPLSLADIITIMYEDLSAQQIKNYTSTIDRFIPDPTLRLGSTLKETGANLLDKSLAVLLRGVIGKSDVKVTQARDAINPVFPYVTSGDGFYKDGSFIQHNNIAYTGSYGSVLLGDISKLLTILDQSSWSIQSAEFDNVWKWVTDSFEPLIYDGHVMEMVSGRAVSRYNNNTRGSVWTILRLAQFAPPEQAAYYKSMVKQWVTADTSMPNMYEGMQIRDIVNFKQLMSDSSIKERGDLIAHLQFTAMDRIIHSREGFTYGISMSSSRISNFEGGMNGEHMKGWYTGDGMTYLYNRDNDQFRNAFWPTVDSYRMPGTTSDGLERPMIKTTEKTWVGGSSMDDLYGVAGMDLAPPGSKLTGKKSWFMFDDEIVALGADISTPDERKDGKQVETIVENRMINTAGSNKLTIDGIAMPSQLGWSQTLKNVGWAHLQGTNEGADIGYYFPGTADVDALREARAGSWKEVNTTGPADEITRNYVSLALGHGTQPNNGHYSYVLLPTFNEVDTAAYSGNPDIEVLSNTAELQAVQETKLGITGMNFWQAGQLNKVRTYQPVSIMLKENGDELTISVSDPTQTQSKVQVEVAAAILEKLMKDSTVTVLQTAPTLLLEIDTRGSKGQSHMIKLKADPNVEVELPATDELEPDEAAKIRVYVSEDTFVNGGTSGADNENTNYSTRGYLNIRNGTGTYDRRVFLKYDLTEIEAEIERATLHVYGQTKDNNGSQADVGVYEVLDDSWHEETLTYKTKPAAGEQIDLQTIASPDEWWQFNVTPFVQTKLQNNKLVSLTLQQVGKDLHTEIRSRKSEEGKYQSYLEIVLKDTQAPVTTVEIEKNDGVTLLFSAKDNENGWGVLKTEYRIDGGQWISVKDGKLVIQKPGNYYIEYRSVDKAGNIEQIQNMTVSIKKPNIEAPEEPGGETPTQPDGETSDNGGESDSNSNETEPTDENTAENVVVLHDIKGHWSEGVIREAVRRGLINGYPDETFRPNQAITRAEFTSLIVRALALQEEAELTFADAEQLPNWAKSDIAKGIAKGFITGYTDQTFRAQKSISRTELAVMAAKAMGLSEGTNAVLTFADAAAIPVWAQGWIAATVENGLILGKNGNRFEPNGEATRAEAVTILMRMLELQTKN